LVCLLVVLLLSVCLADDAPGAFQPDVIARFHINNGKYLIDRGEFLEAHAEFDTALQLATLPALQAESHAWLAQLSATFLDEPNEAIAEYTTVVTRYQNSEFYRNALLQLGMLNYQQQKLEEARAWLTRFAKEFPNDGQVMTAQYLLTEVERYLREKKLPPPPPAPVIGNSIRVALASSGSVTIAAGASFHAPALQKEFRGTMDFHAEDGQIASPAGKLGPGPIELAADQPFRFKGRRYRGSLLLTAQKGDVLVVNKVPLEHYLYSVVGSEMSAGWPAEALKAQAVAARTYAAYAIAHPVRPAFDLYDDVRSQAYNGIANEHPATKAAVDATSGLILRYAGRPIIAYFMANNGGFSGDSKSAFGVAKPYFVAQEDTYSKLERLGHWERQFTEEQIRNALMSFGFSVGKITDIRPALKDNSGRVQTVEIVYGDRSISIRGRNQFRLALNRYVKTTNLPENIPDTLLDIAHQGDVYTISGGGWGHGVGMSQEGAKARARAGQDFAAILRAYYPATEQARLY
jgi:stage II sporulation protein D